MKLILSAALAAMSFIVHAQYTYDKLQVNFLSTDAELKNYTFEDLRLYPIHSNEKFKTEFKDVGNYVSLKDAMAKKKVKIMEKQGGASVNELSVENISSDTVLILSGEIVKGGQQDRIINKDLMLLPKSGKKKLPVFCVESGRWSNKQGTRPGEFNGHYSTGTMSLRKVVDKEPEQMKVWSKVDELNAKNKTETSTKTYTALTNAPAFDAKLKAYLEFFSAKLSKDPDLIGVAVVTGDKVIGCDMFATHRLFEQNFDNLLHAYATEAILNGKAVKISTGIIKTYMDNLLASEKIQEATIKLKGNKFEDKGKKLRIASYD